MGIAGIPFETSSLYKDSHMRTQLDQAKQEGAKAVVQTLAMEKKMARSLVFHVVLTIDVLRDGEVALTITTGKPRPNALHAQQQIEQLQGAKKKLKAMTLDSWVALAKDPTSGSSIFLLTVLM